MKSVKKRQDKKFDISFIKISVLAILLIACVILFLFFI